MAMSGFAVISGFLSREPPTWKRLWTLFDSVILVQILYGVVLAPFFWSFGDDKDCPADHSLTVRFRANVFFGNCQVDWYLQFLAVARILSYCASFVADRTQTPRWFWLPIITLPTALFLHDQNWHAFQGPVYSLNFAPYMLPAFVVGSLFPVSELMSMVPQTLPVRTFGGLFFMAYAFTTGTWPWGTSPVAVFLDEIPFRERGADVQCSYAVPMFKSLLGAALFLVMMATVCPRGDIWCTRPGMDSLYPYLLHRFMIPMLMFDLLALPVVTNSVLHLIVNLLCLGFCVLVALALSSGPVMWVFSPFLKPSCWLNPIVDCLRAVKQTSTS